MYYVFFVLSVFPTFLLTFDFVYYLQTKKRLFVDGINRLLDFIIVFGLPMIYFVFLDRPGTVVNAISGSYDGDTKPVIFTFIGLSATAFIFSNYKTYFSNSIFELIINVAILFGFIVNILIAVKLHSFVALFGNLPIGIAYAYRIIENHSIIETSQDQETTIDKKGLHRIAWNILNAKPLVKYGALLILIVPYVAIICLLLQLVNVDFDTILRTLM